MGGKQARLSLLILILLIPLSAHIGNFLERKLPKRIARLTYSQKGISFSFNKYGKVSYISISRYRKSSMKDSRLPGENEILPGVGAFGIRLGDTVDRVIEKLGKPDYWGKRRYRQIMMYGRKPEVLISLSSDRPATTSITSIVIRGTGYTTPEGITIGSSEEEVLSAYGNSPNIYKSTFSAFSKALRWMSPQLFRALLLGFCLWFIFSRLRHIKIWKLILILIIVSFPIMIIIINIPILIQRLFSNIRLPYLISLHVASIIMPAIMATAAGVGIITGRIFAKAHRFTRRWAQHTCSLTGSFLFYLLTTSIIWFIFYRGWLLRFRYAPSLFFLLALYLSFVIFENMSPLPSPEKVSQGNRTTN